jgi:hypothetical protein
VSRVASLVSAITWYGFGRYETKIDVDLDLDDDSGKRAVQIPDLFSSIMSVPCELCPHYVAARKKSEAYINRSVHSYIKTWLDRPRLT